METPKDLFKLTSIDEHGGHISIIPAEVSGYFKKHRSRVHTLLLIVFLVLPWIHIQGQQLIQLNVVTREFTFFGMLFRAHDAPLIFLLLAIFALGLAFVTAIWGRIWCGWACPQTVFIEGVFRRIEIWTEGNYIERRNLRNAPMSLNKLRMISSKWFLFVVVSSIIAHSFVAYFSGSKELVQMMQGDPTQNWNYFLLVSIFTALILFDFAWFREQFCIIMCPYGRIQSVLLESNSLCVAYDQKRGEPRRGISDAAVKTGDCVSCNRCVQVCPTGIDIRNGLQMECIACTACIDACDDIMTKIKKPTGLIAYKTLDGSPLKFFKIKTLAYASLILICVGVLAFNLGTRDPLNIAVLRAIDSPYSFSVNEKGETLVLNHFRLHLTNQTKKDALYTIALSTESQLNGFKLTVSQNPIQLKSEGSETWHVFLSLDKKNLPANGQLTSKIILSSSTNQTFERDLILVGPKQ